MPLHDHTTPHHISKSSLRWGLASLIFGTGLLGACADDPEVSAGFRGTVVALATDQEGHNALLVTPSPVAQGAVLVYDRKNATLQAAILDEVFVATPEGAKLEAMVTRDAPPIHLVTSLYQAVNVGGLIEYQISPEELKVDVYGYTANGDYVGPVSPTEESDLLGEFSADRIESYARGQVEGSRSHRSCCCKCNDSSCGCTTCSGPSCFCNCVECTVSCSPSFSW